MKTDKITSMAWDIVAREGGYVNDPDDPGGATNHGVTVGTMRRLGIDLDGDGDTDAADVKRLTADQAVEIFVQRYFDAPGIGRLPRCLWESVFDMNVNAGNNAVKILQTLLNRLGNDLVVDGAIGPKTAAAAHAAAAIDEDLLFSAYGVARRNYYYGLGDKRPASRKYARRRDGGKGGWIVRAEEYIAPRFHLTDEQHEERVAEW